MRHAAAGCIVILCLAILSAGLAFTQTPSSEAIPAATVSAADVSLVYVGTSKGVYLYHAAANGQLTLVSGSPFKVAGTIAGSNGKYMISLGTAYMHSYSVASNGAIQRQVSQIDTQKYLTSSDDGCGTTAGAMFDHTGHYIYAPIGIGECAALQSYKISSAGSLAFIGSTNYPYPGGGTSYPPPSPPAITPNELFAYPDTPSGDSPRSPMYLSAKATARFSMAFKPTSVASSPTRSTNSPTNALTADPTGHLAFRCKMKAH